MRVMPGYRWCMLDGAIVQVEQRVVGELAVHEPYDGGPVCEGEHRLVAVAVTAAEYPESRKVPA